MQCPNCQSALQRVIADKYETSRPNIDNKFHKFVVERLPVLHCSSCKQHFVTEDGERTIKKAFKKYLKDNNITVYSDELIEKHLKDVPVEDYKAVRDALCDLVFYNFGNLSFHQLREWIKPVTALDLDSARQLAPSLHIPYLAIYTNFVDSLFKEERKQYARELWKQD